MKCLAVLCALWLSALPALAAPLGTAAPAASRAASPMIRLGDTLDIQVAGEPTLSKNYLVDAAGQITLDLVGQVRVLGRTPSQIEQELRTRLGKFLNRPSVIVTSSPPLRQQVMVTGEVKTPGPVKLQPGDGILDVLSAVGGLTPTGDAARATLVRRGESKPLPLQIDLLLKGDLTRNLSLSDGDIIQVPKREVATYQVLGEVKGPGTRWLDAPIRVLDALHAAGGVTERGDRSNITLTRKGQAQPITIDVDQMLSGKENANLLIQADDVITVGRLMVVQVGGEVVTQGIKLLRNGGTLMEAIALSGGFGPNADRASIQVIHRDRTSETVSLADVTTSTGGPILRVEDTIIVGRTKPQFVTVTGAVAKQGQTPYREGLKLTDVLMAATLQPNAKWKEIRVLRGEEPNRKMEMFNLEAYFKNPQTTNVVLHPGDLIFVDAAPLRQHKPSVLQRLLQVVPLASLFFNYTR